MRGAKIMKCMYWRFERKKLQLTSKKILKNNKFFQFIAIKKGIL